MPGSVEFVKLWAATSTGDAHNAGSDDPIVIIINQDGVDKVHHTVADTRETRLFDLVDNIFEIPVEEAGLRSTSDPNDGTYCRIAIRGPNAWYAEHAMIWGADPGDVDPLYIPLAIRFHINDWFSSSQNEGPVSFPVDRVALGDLSTPINRLIFLAESSPDVTNAHTEDQIRLTISTAAGPVATFLSPEDGSLPAPGARFYQFPSALFTKSEIDEIELEILGEDAWAPSRVFLFGLEMAANHLDVVAAVPLVHVNDWAASDLPNILSTQDGEGKPCATLPLIM